MRDRKKRTTMIITLSLVLIAMAIGYSLISQMLRINMVGRIKGDWDIYIESITPTDSYGRGRSVSSQVESDRLTASFETEFFQPGDYVEYTVVVKNGGAMNAKLSNISFIDEQESEYFEYTNDAEIGASVDAGDTYTFHVKSEFREDVTSWNNEETIKSIASLKMNFVQTSDKDGVPIRDGDSTILVDLDISKTDNDNVHIRYYSDGYIMIYGTGEMMDFAFENTKGEKYASLLQYVFSSYLEEKKGILYDDHYNDSNFGLIISLLSTLLDDPSLLDSITPPSGSEYLYDVIEAVKEFPKNTGINISNGVQSIGANAFFFMHLEGDLILPNSIKSIGEYAFYMNNLNSIVLPNNPDFTEIPLRAFNSSDKVTSITIPNSVEVIGEYAFIDCDNLETVTLSDSVREIQNRAFSQNEKLTTFNFGTGLKTIGTGVFSKTALSSVVFPDGLESVGSTIFANNIAITSVSFPSSINSIGNDALYNALNLNTIIFRGRSNLDGIILGNNWNQIGPSGQTVTPTFQNN